MSRMANRLQRAAGRNSPTDIPVSSTANAGSLPVGQAAYAVPVGALYVSFSGSDTTGDGTSNAPYQTLRKALSMATTGATIVLREGVYHEGGSDAASANGISVYKHNITIQNYPGEAVWFDGSSIQAGWTQSGSAWYIPWTKVFDHSPTATSGAADGTAPGWQWINANYPYAPFPEQVFVDDTPLVQVGSVADCTAGRFYVEGTTSNMIFTPTRLYIGTDPTGHTVAVTDLHQFLNLGSGYTGLIVRGIGIRRYGNALPQYAVFRFDGSNNTAGGLMEHVVIEDVATQATSSNQCHGNTFRHVTVRRAGYGGMAAYRSDNLTYDHVLIEYTNTQGFNSSPDSGGVKITQSQHVTITGSIFRDNACKALWFDVSVYDMKVYGNDFVRNKDTCAFFEISGTGICANNLFVDCPAEAIKVNNTNNMRIWNNTIVNCGALSQRLAPDTSNLTNGDRRPLAVYQETRRPANTSYGRDGRYPLSDAMYSTFMTWVISAIEINNNVVCDTPSNAYAQFCMDDQQVASGGTSGQLLANYGVQMDGNVFHWRSAPTTSYPYPYIMPPATVTSSTPVVYSTHTQLVAATGLNPHGTEINPKGSGTNQLSPIDSSYRIAPSQVGLHTNAVALESTIATLIGRRAGERHVGVWR